MCAGVLTAQWNPQEDLRVTVDEILDFEVQTNRDGVTFVAFWDLVKEDPEKLGNRYSDGSDVAYFLQIIDKDGNKLFPNAGKLISNEPTRSFTMGKDRAIFTDSDGNALYIVKDERNATSGTDQGYFVYKVSPAGELLWDEPLDLDKGFAYELPVNIQVIEDAYGDYIFAHDIYVGSKSYTVIDKVSKAGEFVWGKNNPLLLTDDATSYVHPFLVDAGYGDFIVVYAKGGSFQLYAQKYSFDKEPAWTNPTLIYNDGFPSLAYLVSSVDVISDQKGGCFVGWYDDHNNTKYEKAYVSHILSDGTQGFVTSGEEQGLRLNWNENKRGFRPALAYDPVSENLYAVWAEHNENQSYRSIVLQKISKEGELTWTNTQAGDEGNTNGLLLDFGWSPQAVDYYSIRLAGKEKIVVFYEHDYGANGTENIAALFDVSGEQPEYVWEEERRVFSEKTTGTKSGLISLPLFNNEYFLTFWSDFRAGYLSEGAVFAHKIPFSDNGDVAIRVPETGSNSSFGIIVNRIDGKIDFVLESAAAGKAGIEIYSVSGMKVAALQSKLHNGENVIPYDVRRLPSGVYIAQVTTPNGVQTQRFIVQ
jgi:hypothetical protein